MTRRAEVQIPLNERLIDGEDRNPGLTWPLAVDRWLEQTLSRAKAAGLSTSRRELAAALMTSRDLTDDALGKLLRDYRRKTAGELLKVVDDSGVVTFLRQPPGPRSNRRR